MTASDDKAAARRDFDRLLGELRPKLHRYCARMTGSVFDGEDVLQDALGKAIRAFDEGGPPGSLEAWLVRIAHNTAIDFLRRRARQAELFSAEDAAMIADASPTAEDRRIAATGLGAFMALPALQRSSVILMDVLGYSLREISLMLEQTIPAVKAALHRGRDRLRAAAALPEDRPAAALAAADRALLERYVDRFNARDFDAIRDMLADEVRLEVVGRARLAGPAEIRGRYLHNYALAADWHLSLGAVEGRPVLVARDPADAAGTVSYVVQVAWARGRLTEIRDFRYARYITEDATIGALT